MTITSFQILKADLHQTRLKQSPQLPLSSGEVRLAIGRFAFTANNITYAAFGDAMRYWQFYPTSDDAWGSIPVWGFADVIESACEGLAVGERFYGYFPMASHVTLRPARITEHGFYDNAPHRTDLHPVYNQYVASRGDPLYSADTEDIQALLRPLFVTSFLIDDFLADNDFFGACASDKTGVMLLSSASSKTAYGTAFQLAQRSGIEVVGLTSAANVEFCNSLGCYHRVFTYDQLDLIGADAPCVYIDFAGNSALRQRIHSQFSQLKYSCSIGGTHVDELSIKGTDKGGSKEGSKGGGKDLPGVRATLFFAPAQIKKRSTDWGAAGLRDRLGAAWQAFTHVVSRPAAPWLLAQHSSGPAAVEAVYQTVLAGKGDPRLGHVLTI